jgi:hypothetical protein
MGLLKETVRRHIDEADCDHCGRPCYVGDRVYIDLQRGTVYCSRDCAAEDQAAAVPMPQALDSAG